MGRARRTVGVLLDLLDLDLVVAERNPGGEAGFFLVAQDGRIRERDGFEVEWRAAGFLHRKRHRWDVLAGRLPGEEVGKPRCRCQINDLTQLSLIRVADRAVCLCRQR